MDIFIKNFSDLNKNDAAIAGGKGASLGEMTNAGIPVPPGFVVLSAAFEKFLEETDLNIEIDSLLEKVKHEDINTVEQASEKIQALILSAKMPDDIANLIQKYFNELGTEYVAVRSSATAEDSASAAWAGQLDSFLNTTETDLLEKVKRCWASLFTPRAIFYRFEQNLHTQKISVAVVIQKMVVSEVSGIAFSVHPVTQDYNQLIIEAGFGLGEAIVSGQITPDSYVVEKAPRRIIDKNIVEQTRGIFRIEGGTPPSSGISARQEANEWRDISSERGNQQKINDKQILELSEIILGIEKHYGFPCDIEWAYENGVFYIVQSRPITTLVKKETEIKKEVWETTDDEILDKKWVFLVGRPYTLFGASLYQLWFDPSQIFELFDASIPDNLYIEEHPNVVRRYVIKEQLDNFSKVIEKLVLNDTKKTKEILEIGLKLNEEAKKYLEKSFFLDLRSALDFLVKLTLHATVFPYFSYAVIKEQKSEELLKLVEGLRATSYYPIVVEKIIKPLAKQLVGDDFDFMTVSEILTKDNLQVAFRRQANKQNKRFIYSKIDGKEVVRYVYNITEVIEKLEGMKISHEVKGQVAYPGKITGRVRLILTSNVKVEFNKGDILVAVTSNPTLMPLILKSGAIVTNEGGIMSHAAIISRELKKPCVIGTKFATHTFKDGDLVEVDADNGQGKRINFPKLLANNCYPSQLSTV
jgi:phosphoenolpyruvate synthase/pyruvate phosphate dikinase